MAQEGVIRISRSSLQTVRQIARRRSESIQSVVEKAIDELSRKQIIDDANATYAALRNNSAAWGAEAEERKVFGGALHDDLESNEVWSEDGSVDVNV
ncbi:MAG TPA: hypothetical protein VGB17_09020 [Pyrinomonadaceae bacterium]|jgi:hypothetical protein